MALFARDFLVFMLLGCSTYLAGRLLPWFKWDKRGWLTYSFVYDLLTQQVDHPSRGQIARQSWSARISLGSHVNRATSNSKHTSRPTVDSKFNHVILLPPFWA